MTKNSGAAGDPKDKSKAAVAEDGSKAGVVGGSGRVWHILAVEDLPEVPADQEKVLADAAQVLRRFPEASYAEGISGLKEVAARGVSHPGELGDLVAPPEQAGAAAIVLTRGRAVVTRLEALIAYHRAMLGLEENSSNVMIDTYEEEATKRIAKARIPPEAYEDLRKYVGARGDVISRGKAQAKALQEARTAPKGDAAKPPVDGTPTNG